MKVSHSIFHAFAPQSMAFARNMWCSISLPDSQVHAACPGGGQRRKGGGGRREEGRGKKEEGEGKREEGEGGRRRAMGGGIEREGGRGGREEGDGRKEEGRRLLWLFICVFFAGSIEPFKRAIHVGRARPH